MRPTNEQRAVVFRAEDGREVTFGLLYDALVLLGASSWDAFDMNYVFRRLAEELHIVVTEDRD